MGGPRPSSTLRGYGARHQQLRARLLAQLVPGTPCPQTFPRDGTVCGQPMWPGQELHLGHADNGSYLGLVHAICNLRAAQQKASLRRMSVCENCGQRYKGRSRSRLRLCPSCREGQSPPKPVSRGRAW